VDLVATEFVENAPAISPDGRWLAYASNETGRSEVYVRPFPDVSSAKYPVTSTGGAVPMWARDGGELFYIRGDTMMTVRVETSLGFRVIERSALFEIPQEILSVGSASWMDAQNIYDVAADGRFLMGRRLPPQDQVPPKFVLIQNFAARLRALPD
jgi:hypothetical protein